jgi:hypothetical protein
MSLNSPKHSHDIPRHSFGNFRNVIAAIVLSTGIFSGGKALSAPINTAAVKDDPILQTPSKIKKPLTEVQKKCGLTGGVKLAGEKIMLETICIIENKLSVQDVILTADKSGHFNIPGTNAYIYVDEQKPLISFEKDGERVTGIMISTEDGGFSFEQYLEFIPPKKEDAAKK